MSHLTTIIGRVRNAERHNPARLDGLLLNLVEYMRYWTDYTPEESEKANYLLEKHDFKIPKDLEDPQVGYSQSCVRCGRALSNPASKKRGMGPQCWTKRSVGGRVNEQQKTLGGVCDYPQDCKVD